MSKLFKTLLLIVFASTPLFAAVQPALGADAPQTMEVVVGWIFFIGLGLLFGIMIPWSLWRLFNRDYNAVLVLFVSITIVAMSIGMFFGDYNGDGFFSRDTASSIDANDEGTTGYQWKIYGDTPGTATHFTSQGFSYEAMRGWLLSGAIYYFQVLDFLFATYILPTYLFLTIIIAVHQAKKEHEAGNKIAVWTAVKHFGFVIFVGGITIWPMVKFDTNIGDNPVMAALTDYEPTTTAPAQNVNNDFSNGPNFAANPSARLPIYQTAILNVTTEMAEALGERVTFGSRDPYTIIAGAALQARLDADDYASYMDYATTCFGTIKNVISIRSEVASSGSYSQVNSFLTNLSGNLSNEPNGGAIGQYYGAPIFMRHALSPYSEALFTDINILRWYPHDMYTVFDEFDPIHLNYQGFKETFSEYTYHPTIDSPGKGRIVSVDVDSASQSRMPLWNMFSGFWRGQARIRTWDDYIKASHGLEYVAFCSLSHRLRANADRWQDLDTQWLPGVEDNLLNGDTAILNNKVAVAWDDVVRHKIARRYLGPDSVEFCNGVSPDRNSEHLWGCLVAGRYRSTATEQDRVMAEVQTVFDNKFRLGQIAPVIKTALDNTNHHRAYTDMLTSYWDSASGGSREGSKWEPDIYRDFNDQFFMAPGVQMQIGLKGDLKSYIEGDESSSNAFIEFLMWIGGPMGEGILGFFAWIASFIARVVLMLYHHIYGLMGFMLILGSLPFVIVGMWPKKWPTLVRWARIAVVFSITPIFQQLGLSWLEQSNNSSMVNLMVYSTAGYEIGSSILQLFGAFFVMTAFSLSVAFMSIGGGELYSLLHMIQQNGYKIISAGGAATVTMLGITASAVTKGAVSAAAFSKLQSSINQIKDGTSGDSDSGGGGGGDSGPGGPGGPQNRLKQEASLLAESTGGLAGDSVKAGSNMLMATSASIATSMDADPNNPDGGALASGAILGRVGVEGMQRSASGISAGAMQAINQYSSMRNQDGSLPSNVGIDEISSNEFANVAGSYDYDFNLNNNAGNSVAAANAAGQAGQFWHDAARLSDSPSTAAQYSLNSAMSYMNAGNASRAEESLAMFNNFQNGQKPGNMFEQARFDYMNSVGESMNMNIAHAQGHAERIPEHFSNVQMYGDASFQNWGGVSGSAYESAVTSNQVSDWAAYGGSVFNQYSAASAVDSAATFANSVGVNVGASNRGANFIQNDMNAVLNEANMGNNRAAAIYGGVLAANGQEQEAQKFFEQAGVKVSADEYARLRSDASKGDNNMIKQIMRRL